MNLNGQSTSGRRSPADWKLGEPSLQNNAMLVRSYPGQTLMVLGNNGYDFLNPQLQL